VVLSLRAKNIVIRNPAGDGKAGSVSGGREKALSWGAEAPLTTRVEPPMASSAWSENVARGLTSNEFVKRAMGQSLRRRRPCPALRAWNARRLHKTEVRVVLQGAHTTGAAHELSLRLT
jgi:hypothetical protein